MNRTLTLTKRCFAVLAPMAAGVTLLAATPAPAQAALGVACPDAASKVFLPWADLANYTFAPDGGFEAGAAGWKLSGAAQVVAGNESFDVHAATDSRSLRLGAGSSATSPSMCVGALDGKMRFFTANAGDPRSRLKVQVLYKGGTGSLLGSLGTTLGVADVGYVTSGGAWQPSPEIPMLGGMLPLLTSSVQFRFTPVDTAGDWRIDDVYLDPLIHR